MDAVKFSGEGTPDVPVLGVEGLLKSILCLPEGLRFSFVCLDVGGQVEQFFLD